MINWHHTPFIRLLLPFIAGIVIALTHHADLPAYWLFLALIILISASIFTHLNKNIGLRWIYGLAFNCFFCVLGISVVIYHDDRNLKSHISYYLQDSVAIQKTLVHLEETPIERLNSYRANAAITYIYKDKEWQGASGKVLIYFAKSQSVQNLKHQQYLAISNKIKEVAAPVNPYQFNYKRYLSLKDIHHQVYADSNSWQTTSFEHKKTFKSTALSIRDKLLEILEKNIKSTRERSVAEAIILGYKGDLDQDTRAIYASTGVMHVLAVSGLHVGIIYLLLNSLLIFMDKIRKGYILKGLLLLLGVWIFAMITGLSPSVQRAATMFSFLIIGKGLNKHSNIYNILAASAFFLLVFDPKLLFNVGFQLSYIAVTGIVFLQPKLYNLFEFNYYLVDKIWAITTVSISAQIATFPLGLYYFHQFPIYFLFTNLIVIPVVTLIMQLGVLLFIVSFIDPAATVIGFIIEMVLKYQNMILSFFSKMPFSGNTEIYINEIQLCLIYALITIIIAVFILKRPAYLLACLSTSCLLVGCFMINKYQNLTRQETIELSIPKHDATIYVNGRSGLILVDEALMKEHEKINYVLGPIVTRYQLKEISFISPIDLEDD